MRLGNSFSELNIEWNNTSEKEEFRVLLNEVQTAASLVHSWMSGKPGTLDRVALVSGRGNVITDEQGVRVYNGSILTGWWQPDGDMFLGSNILAAATTSFSFFSNAQTYNGEALGAGDALFGDNSVNKASMLWDYSAGQLQFRGGPVQGTVQAYVGTDGRIYFGGGNGWLSSDGIRLSQGTDSANKIIWLNSSVERASVYSYQGSSQSYILLSSCIPNAISDAYAHARLTAYMSDTLGSEVQIQCTATNDADSENSVDFYINGTGSGSHWYVNREQFDYDFYVGTALVPADTRVSGGVYIGSTATDPAEDSLTVDGNVGFGVVASTATRFTISGATSDLATQRIIRTDATAALGGPNLLLGVNDGAQIDAGHRLGFLGFQSTYDGTDANLGTVANIFATTLEAHTSTSKGTLLEFRRNPIGIVGNRTTQAYSEKALTDNTATPLFEVALPDNTGFGCFIAYTAYVFDTVNDYYQVIGGALSLGALNNGGSYVVSAGSILGGIYEENYSASTAAEGWTITTGTNKVTINYTLDTNLTGTMKIIYTVINNSPQALTFL